MRAILIVLWGTLLSAQVLAQQGFELKVSVQNIEQQKGRIRVCVTNKKADFLKTCFLATEVRAVGNQVTAIFKNVPSGEYAVAVYHDVDENGILNKEGVFGIPSEDYGFSNNPRAMFGPPSYEKCAFWVTSDKTVLVKL